MWRGIAAAVAATAVVAVCLTFVTSAIALTETPSRYGFDADLLALNAYGDQSTADLEEAFGERDDVVAATGFITGSYLVEGLAVPGLAATTVRGDVTPTLLSGRSGLTDDEIVLGEDTLESVDAELGDLVSVQLLAPSGAGDEPDNAPVDLRVVGVATFPPVNQTGTDMPRLGIGALVARDAYLQMGGSADNSPEFTMVRMADGADPAAVIADLPEGFEDRVRITTTWFTDTKPAELLQLDAAMSYLRVARLASFGILLAVVVHACWVRARADRRDLAVLRVVGFTRRQLDSVAAWQVAPLAVGALVLGVPLGVIVGRRVYMLFAQSLAVVDEATISRRHGGRPHGGRRARGGDRRHRGPHGRPRGTPPPPSSARPDRRRVRPSTCRPSRGWPSGSGRCRGWRRASCATGRRRRGARRRPPGPPPAAWPGDRRPRRPSPPRGRRR